MKTNAATEVVEAAAARGSIASWKNPMAAT